MYALLMDAENRVGEGLGLGGNQVEEDKGGREGGGICITINNKDFKK